MDDRVTRVAWLNRSTILYAGNDKWSIDNRVVILSNTKTQYSIKIHNVDIYDEGPYTCSVQTDNHPKTSRVHLIVQGRSFACYCQGDRLMWKDVWVCEELGGLLGDGDVGIRPTFVALGVELLWVLTTA